MQRLNLRLVMMGVRMIVKHDLKIYRIKNDCKEQEFNKLSK
jgi:hypothetical protein